MIQNLEITKGEKRMADGKRRYKSDRKDYKISVKLSEKDMDILKAALKRTGMTASAYIRELIRTGGNIDTSYPEDRAKIIRVIAGIANNINQAVKLGNSQGRLYYSDVDKLQNSLDDVKKTFGELCSRTSDFSRTGLYTRMSHLHRESSRPRRDISEDEFRPC